MSREDRGLMGGRRARRRSAGRDLRDPWTRLIVGIALVVFGAVVWLDRMGKINGQDYVQWWPLIFLAFGFSCLLQRRWIAGAINFAIASMFLPDIAFVPHLHLETFYRLLGVWPLLITAAGFTLVSQALRPLAKDAPGAAGFRSFTMMGGSARRLNTPRFVGGDTVVVMGHSLIDLSKAVAASEAAIDVLVFWGGVEIIVPRGWRVESRVTPILAGYSDRTSPPIGEDAPRLIIRGSAIMGGIEVKNPKEQTW